MRILLAGALAAALALGACGSDGDGEADLASRDSATTTVAIEETTTSSMVEETTTTAGAPGAPATTAARRPTAAPTTVRPAAGPATTAAPAPAQPATTAAPPPAAPPDINIQNFTFNPAVLNVAKGKKVTVKNLDSASHTWTADDNSWNSNTLAKDQTFSHTFNASGTFAYHCAIHPSMKGTVNVQ